MCMMQGRAGTGGKGEAEAWGLVKAGDKKVTQCSGATAPYGHHAPNHDHDGAPAHD